MKSLLVLGSTGSIGTQTLDVVRASGGRLGVTGLAAGSSWERVLDQVAEFSPRFVALHDPAAAERLRAAVGPGVTVFEGPEALTRIVAEAPYDTAVHGVVGARGLPASVGVLERGKALALANKESLVIAGAELMELARTHGGVILPVDSELCALHQCLRGESTDGPAAGNGLSADATRRVRRIVLTASGGALRDLPLGELAGASPEQSLGHPNWSMGPRITVGSATLMNKALEVLEVHHLFGLSAQQIHVVLHRQSVVHSMVEFVDGSVLAQMGPPDMRGPLHYCLHAPERAPAELTGYDTRTFSSLTFEEVDPERFPALALGYRCLEEGGDAGSTLNAADEVAVEAFLEGRIAFGDIYPVNERVLNQRPGSTGGVPSLIEADARARELARSEIDAVCVR